MSAHRLALSNLLRNGPRFSTLPHAPVQAQNEAHTDDDSLPLTGRTVEACLPLVNIVRQFPFSVPNVTAPRVSLNVSWVLNSQSVFDNSIKHRIPLNAESEASRKKIAVKPSSVDASCQTDFPPLEVDHAAKRLDDLKWQIEADMGEALVFDGAYKEGLARLRKAANNGNVQGMQSLADCLFNGVGAEVNKKEAIRLWRQAACLGDGESQYALATCYLRGDGVAANAERAAEFMERAAQGGNSHAAFYYVVRWMRAGDAERARRWISVAARADDYCHEMRSWIEDECLLPASLEVIKEELGIVPAKE